MTEYRRHEWIALFEMAKLRPHLIGKPRDAVSPAAWRTHGTKGIDPAPAGGLATS